MTCSTVIVIASPFDFRRASRLKRRIPPGKAPLRPPEATAQRSRLDCKLQQLFGDAQQDPRAVSSYGAPRSTTARISDATTTLYR
jgi:hypothetical protein